MPLMVRQMAYQRITLPTHLLFSRSDKTKSQCLPIIINNNIYIQCCNTHAHKTRTVLPGHTYHQSTPQLYCVDQVIRAERILVKHHVTHSSGEEFHPPEARTRIDEKRNNFCIAQQRILLSQSSSVVVEWGTVMVPFWLTDKKGL